MSAPTILVAEDNEHQRLAIGAFFKRHGYRVICAEDGYQALEFALKDKPDLLLLDVHMPGGDGFSVHERVARHPELALTPVIYMTRDPSPEMEAIARGEGGIALLHKPFELDDLLGLVTAALNRGRSDAA